MCDRGDASSLCPSRRWSRPAIRNESTLISRFVKDLEREEGGGRFRLAVDEIVQVLQGLSGARCNQEGPLRSRDFHDFRLPFCPDLG